MNKKIRTSREAIFFLADFYNKNSKEKPEITIYDFLEENPCGEKVIDLIRGHGIPVHEDLEIISVLSSVNKHWDISDFKGGKPHPLNTALLYDEDRAFLCIDDYNARGLGRCRGGTFESVDGDRHSIID